MTAPEHRGDATDRILTAAIPGPQKLILTGYLRHMASDRAPAEGSAWPSIDLLCSYTSNGTKTTSAHRAALIDAGILVVLCIRPGNVPECRIDFGALEAAGRAQRGASVSPGNRGGSFGKDCRCAKTADAQRLPIRFGKDCARGSAKTAPEPSPRTLSKNPLQSSSGSTTEQTTPEPAPAPPEKTTPSEPDTLTALWARIQDERLTSNPAARGQALTAARRRNLQARRSELRAAGFTDDDLVAAVRWVMTSPNMRAEGARKTGTPVLTLLRPSKCVEYVELAMAERPAVRSASIETVTDPAAWVSARLDGLREGWARAQQQDPKNPHGAFHAMLVRRVANPRDVTVAFWAAVGSTP